MPDWLASWLHLFAATFAIAAGVLCGIVVLILMLLGILHLGQNSAKKDDEGETPPGHPVEWY